MLSPLARLLRNLMATEPKPSSTSNRRKTNLRPIDLLEDRCVPATLNLVAGNLVYSAGNNVANGLAVSYDSGLDRYTFSDVESITVIGVADLDPAANTATVSAAGVTGIVNINVGNLGDTIAINSFKSSEEGLTLQGGTGDDTANINASLTVAAAQSLNFSAGFDTAADVINLAGSNYSGSVMTLGLTNASINLAADITVNVTGFTANGTINSTGSARDLSVTTTQNAVFNNSIGGTLELDQFSVTANGAGRFAQFGALATPANVRANNINVSANGAGGQVIASGDMTAVTDDISITTPSLRAQSNGLVTYTTGGGAGDNFTLTGQLAPAVGTSPDVTINSGSGDASITGGSTGAIDALTITGATIDSNATLVANSITLNPTTSANIAGNLTANTGAVNVNGPITFDGAANVTVTAATNVSFTGTVQGGVANKQLNVRAPGDVTFGGAVSGTLTAVDVQTGGGGQVNSITAAAITAGTINLEAVNLTLNGNLTATTDDVTIVGDVTTSVDLTIQSGLGAGDDINIDGDVNDDAIAPVHTLVLNAGAGSINVIEGVSGGRIGNLNPFLSVSTEASTTNLVSVATTTGGITHISDNLELNGNQSGTGVFLVRQRTNNRDINLGVAGTSGTALQLSTTEVNSLVDGFSLIDIGDENTGVVTVVSALNFQDPLRINSSSTVAVNAALTVTQVGGSLTFITRELNLTAAVTGTGVLNIMPPDLALPILIGGAVDQGAGVLDLTTTDIANITNGFSLINIGSAASTSTITVFSAASISINDPLTLNGGAVQVVQTDLTVDGALTLDGSEVNLQDTTIAGKGSPITIQNGGGALQTNIIQDVVLDTTNGGANPAGHQVDILGAVDKVGALNTTLTITTGAVGVPGASIVRITGDIGGTTPLDSFTITSAKNRAELKNIDAGVISVAATTIIFTGDHVTSTLVGGVTLTGNVRTNGAGANFLIDTTATSSDINITGTLGGVSSGIKNLTLSAGSGNINISGAVGSNVQSATFNGGNMVFGSSIQAVGDLTFNNTGILNLKQLLESNTGTVAVNGAANLTGNLLVQGGAGTNFGFIGGLTGNNFNLTIRGKNGAALNHVHFFGGSTGLGILDITNQTNGPALITIDNTTASKIIAKAAVIRLDGNLTSASNVQLTGAVELNGVDVTVTTGGLAAHTFAATGTITGTGTEDLTINAGNSTTAFGGVISGLNDMSITGGGFNALTNNATVSGNFDWVVNEVTTNNDRIIIVAGKTITSTGGGNITLNAADTVTVNQATQLITTGTKTVIQGGNP